MSSAQTTTPKVSQKKTLRSTLPVTRSGTNAQAEQGEDVYGVELNNILHNFVDRVVTQGLADEVSARQSADTLLAGFINALNALVPEGASSSNKLVSASQLNVVQASISDIEDLIPSQASDQNQLADKSFVNSSIATNTANFLGTYTTLADIQAIQNPTNNDYAFLQTTDQAGNTKFDRYKYNSESSQWLYEYTLNNSSFTAEQWATINSGLTASSVSDAIGALDVASVGGSGKYIESISEVDGKIVPVEASIATSVALNNLHSVSSDAVAQMFNALFHQGVKYGSYDCNTMGEGLCLINEDVANSPYKQGVVGSQIAYLLTMAISTNISSYRIQLCLTYGSNILCVRGYTDSGWIAWTRIN